MVALQGNMDPSVLYAPAERIEQEVRSILADFGQGSGHVFNLGSWYSSRCAGKRAKIFVDAILEFSKSLS